MPGPAPNPNARRRNARPTGTQLPAQGYDGDLPKWPLSGRSKAAEVELWKMLWGTPQAAAWATLGKGTIRTVARYCRLSIEADQAGAMATLLSEVRQLEDRLGLTPMSMRRLMWEIATDEVGEKRDEAEQAAEPSKGTRRLKAVDDAVAGT